MNDFVFSDSELLSLLKPYQQRTLLPLIDSVGEEEAAKIWLSPSSDDQVANFGGGGNQPDLLPPEIENQSANSEDKPALYYDKLVKEIKKLICGDEKYQEYREKTLEHASTSALVAVTFISATMGDIFGVAPALLTPVVILILKAVSKVGINAWCEA